MTLHADALAVLRSWDPPSPAQEAHRSRFVTHLEAQPQGMDRGCFPAHLTAGTLVLSSELDRVLLNHHRKADGWFAFGGHPEPGDHTLAGVALREAVEESGIEDLELDPVPVELNEHAVEFCDPRGTVQHLDVRFTALARVDAEHRVSAESFDISWFPVDELPPGIYADMEQLIAVARSRWRDPTRR